MVIHSSVLWLHFISFLNKNTASDTFGFILAGIKRWQRKNKKKTKKKKRRYIYKKRWWLFRWFFKAFLLYIIHTYTIWILLNVHDWLLVEVIQCPFYHYFCLDLHELGLHIIIVKTLVIITYSFYSYEVFIIIIFVFFFLSFSYFYMEYRNFFFSLPTICNQRWCV